MQRPWGAWCVLGVAEGGETEPGHRGHQETWGQVVWGCGRHYENLALTLGEVGAWEGPEQRVDQMSWAPSGCLGAGSVSRWGESPVPRYLLNEVWTDLADMGYERTWVLRLLPDPQIQGLKCWGDMWTNLK